MKTLITPRPVKFTFKDHYPKYWYDYNPAKTYYANVLAAYIPHCEKFIISTVKSCRDMVKNPTLKEDIKAFLQQESYHTREHFKFLHKVVMPHYPGLKLSHNKFFILLIFMIVGGKKTRLVMTAAGEHFTAVLSHLFLSQPELFNGIDDELVEFWRWHFIEEIEHKSVTFDMLDEAKCGYLLRVYGFLLATLFYFSAVFRAYIQMAKQDKCLLSFKFYWQSIKYFWGKSGVMRQCVKPYLAFLNPKFHPSQIEDNELIERWVKASKVINT